MVKRKAIFPQAWRWARIISVLLAGGACHAAVAESPHMPNPLSAEQPNQERSSQAETELQAGIALSRSGRFADAIPHFLAARGHVSEEYAAEFNLALCFVGIGEFQKAIPILVALRNGGHENAGVENLLSQAYVGNDQAKQAFEAFEKAAAFTPQDEKLYLLVAAAFLERQDYGHGLRVVESGLRDLPNSAKLHYELGYVLWQLEEPVSAKPEFERATSLSPNSALGYLAAAQESFMLGNLAQAIQMARTAIREGATDYQLLALLGDALIQAGASPGKPEFSEAKEALRKSIGDHPRYASSHIALGRLLLQEGRVDQAVEHLELGRQLAPQNPAPCLLLATAYRKRGQLEQERAMLAIVAKLNEEQAERRRSDFNKER
jgi:tetratricopeptide (TPR) repeat protein